MFTLPPVLSDNDSDIDTVDNFTSLAEQSDEALSQESSDKKNIFKCRQMTVPQTSSSCGPLIENVTWSFILVTHS